MPATAETHPIRDKQSPPWDRRTGFGIAISMVAPLAAVLLANAVMGILGSEEDAAYQAVPWNPPGWVIGAIWTVIYPMWGAARWNVATSGDSRADRSWWLVALIVWGFLYPVVIEFVGTIGSVVANGLSLLLAIWVLMRVRTVSSGAAWLIAPSLAWLVVANVLGWNALRYT